MPGPAKGGTDDRFRLTRRAAGGAFASALLMANMLPSRSRGVARASAQPGTPPSVPFAERLATAADQLARLDVPAIVGISHERGPIVVRVFGGLADDGVSGEAESTQIDLNSITKTVTAVMVLKLVEQSKARLDEPLTEMFSSVPEDKVEISVHHLLTHSAGFVESVGSDDERLDREGFLQRAFGTELLVPPGTEYRYSNVGFSILAAIIEARSGKTYDAYLQEDVLPGTGVEHTGYLSVYDDGRSLLSADGRSIMEASWGGHEPGWNLIGNGGLVSTIPDFVRFRQAVTAGNILTLSSVEASQVKHVPEDAEGSSHYGYGLVVQDVPDIGRVYWHDGGNDVFSAMWADAVDQDDVVVVAAADTQAGDAISVMSVLQEHLYGVPLG